MAVEEIQMLPSEVGEGRICYCPFCNERIFEPWNNSDLLATTCEHFKYLVPGWKAIFYLQEQ